MSLIYTAPAASAGVSSRNGLYIGGKKEAKSRSTLERWGITHILNVTPEKDSSIQVRLAVLHVARDGYYVGYGCVLGDVGTASIAPTYFLVPFN